MKKNLFILGFLFVSMWASSQDTIRIMTYNLLYYNLITDFCTTTNNSLDDKDGWLKTVIAHTLPDIVAFNEVLDNVQTKYHLKGSVLNVDGRTNYMEAPSYELNNLSSFLYYDKNKFSLFEVYNINTGVSRSCKIYKLLRKNTDPKIFLYVIPAHLAAGSNSIADRAQMADSVISYIASRGDNDNFIFLGDLNFYTSKESGFQKLTNNSNPEYRFYDPINQLGDWHINASFKNYHTQSTHTDDGGCKVPGGLDDRFDIILVDDDILSGASRVKYIEDSYTTVGQDGNHFNQSLIAGGNTSVPSDLLNALYNMSDHLPVYADFVVGAPSSSPNYSLDNVKINYVNPMSDKLVVQIFAPIADSYELILFSSAGVKLYNEAKFVGNSDSFVFDVSHLKQGVYFLTIRNSQGSCSRKLVKL